MIIGKGFEWSRTLTELLTEYSKTLSIETSFRKVIKDVKDNDKKRILKGSDESGIYNIEWEDVELNLSDFERHSSIVGVTGSGKTTIFKQILSEAVKDNPNIGILIIDPKPDTSLESACRQIAKKYDKNMKVFDPLKKASETDTYNPIEVFDRTLEIAARFEVLFPGEEGARPYKQFATSYILVVSEALIGIGKKPTIYNLLNYASKDEIGTLMEEVLKKERNDLYTTIVNFLKTYETMGENNFIRMMTNIHQTLLTLSLFPLCPGGEPGAIRIDKAMDNGWIVYVKLTSMKMLIYEEWIGKIFLSDYMSYIGGILHDKEAGKNIQKKSFLLIDEAGDFVFTGVEKLLRLARSAGIMSIFSLQAYEDIHDKIIYEAMIQNTALKLFMKNERPESIETIAEILGNVKIESSSGQKNASGGLTATTRYEDVPMIPNEVMRLLEPGEFFISLGSKKYYCKGILQ